MKKRKTCQLGQRFETYAERYRAQADRSFGGPALPPDEIYAIQKTKNRSESQVS